MILLNKAVRDISEMKRETIEKAFHNASTDAEGYQNFVRAVGVTQGLDMALNAILALTRGEDERD